MPSLSPSSRRSFWRRSALRPRASARSISVAFAICVDVTALRTGATHASMLYATRIGCLRPASGQPGLRHLTGGSNEEQQRPQCPVQGMALFAAATVG